MNLNALANEDRQIIRQCLRRNFLTRTSAGLGVAALGRLLHSKESKPDWSSRSRSEAATGPHFIPRAKRVIYLFMSGGPSHVDLFDPKPRLRSMHGQEMPESVRASRRVTTMTRNQSSFPCAGSPFQFNRHGASGIELSELLPHHSRIADHMAVVRSVWSETINHDPAVTLMQTGSSNAGRPCIGSWLSYGLGSENLDLPTFIVLLSGVTFGQPVLSRYWHSGFLPSRHQGVQFRSTGDPVLFLSNPPGVNQQDRAQAKDTINLFNQLRLKEVGDPEIEARIQSFELAYRMQTSVPDLIDLTTETQETLNLYGVQPGQASFAANCLLARRLVERGVPFVQLYHKDWDHHQNLPEKLPVLTKETDQGSAALVLDLHRRGLLEDTLVIWGGEFGRTSYCQGKLTSTEMGRDHHPHCFSMWLAGGGIRSGITYGTTDEFGYTVAEKPVHVHDFQATILHCLGIDHTRLTFRFQGRDFRLTDVQGTVLHELLGYT